jgi:hypothetical protein
MKSILLPSETFTIETQDSIEVVRQRLVAQVQDSSTIRSSQDAAVFRGQVSERGFKISLTSCQTSFYLPTIIGRLEYIQNTTVIYVRMRLSYKAYLINILYLLGLLGILGSLINSVLNEHKISINYFQQLFLTLILVFAGIETSLNSSQPEFNLSKTKLEQVILDRLCLES